VREKFQFLSLAAGIGGLLNFREDQKQCPLIKCANAKGGQRTMDGDGLRWCGIKGGLFLEGYRGRRGDYLFWKQFRYII